MKTKKRPQRKPLAKKTKKQLVLLRKEPTEDQLKFRELLRASSTKRSIFQIMSEPDCDLRDACFSVFDEKIRAIPADGRGVQTLLKNVISWQNRENKKYPFLTGKWNPKTKKTRHVTIKDPFFTQYLCVLGVAAELLIRDIPFNRKSVELLMPYVGQAMASVFSEGWFDPQHRADTLRVFTDSLVRSCPALVEQLPVFDPMWGQLKRRRRTTRQSVSK